MSSKSILKKAISGGKIVLNRIKQKNFEFFLTPGHFDKLQRAALPRKAAFNVSNFCTSNCVFCAYQYNRDPKTIMPNDLFEICCEQFSRLQPDSWISLTPIVGEPFTDQGIFTKIEIAKNKNIKRVEIYSNGTLLKKNIDAVLNSPLDELYISFPDFNEEEYKIIFRTDNYKISLEGIHELLRRHQAIGSQLLIRLNMRPRRDRSLIFQEDDFLRYIQPFLSDNVTIDFMNFYDNWGGIIKQEDLPEGMFLEQDQKREVGLPCRRIFEIIFLQNGDVKLGGCRCKETVFDDLSVGNIYESSLRDIWFSELVFEIRNKFLQGTYPSICRECSHYKRLTHDILK